ncbi:hypothetical protein RB595_007272 [Gaeumannomyces hyphopodioides]
MAARIRSGVYLSTPDGHYHVETSSPPVFYVTPNPTASEDWCLATLVDFQGSVFDQHELASTQQALDGIDDVWGPSFLQVIILQARHHVQIADEIHQSHQVIIAQNDHKGAAPAPYAIQNLSGKVFPICKLYRDLQKAFVTGVAPDGASGESTCREFDLHDQIPVPSRLYSPPRSTEKPLSGLRFAVKDVIDVAGLVTGCGSAAWAATYPARASTAPLVSRLIAAGAVLVGKLRCAQFCDGQDPLERIEEETPWNPRGDGFQKPSSSSSGSAAAAAAYQWLDFTIGTDTGGSIRHPAGVCGIFGLRPSLIDDATLGDNGGLVVSKLMDVVGPFTRSMKTMHAVTRCIVGPQDGMRLQFRLKIMIDPRDMPDKGVRFLPTADHPSLPNANALQTFHKVFAGLESYAEMERTYVDIYDLWRQTRPEGTPAEIEEATKDIYSKIVYKNLHDKVISKLSKDYQTKHAGEKPFIEPLLSARVKYGAGVSRSEYEVAEATFRIFGDWVNRVLFSDPTGKDDRIPIIVFPQAWGVPQYRDDVVDRKSGNLFWSGFSAYSLSYCSGCPDITVPVGQVPSESKFTQAEMQLPIALSFLSPKGTDMRLMAFLKHMEEKGVFSPVQCGRAMYPVEV